MFVWMYVCVASFDSLPFHFLVYADRILPTLPGTDCKGMHIVMQVDNKLTAINWSIYAFHCKSWRIYGGDTIEPQLNW